MPDDNNPAQAGTVEDTAFDISQAAEQLKKTDALAGIFDDPETDTKEESGEGENPSAEEAEGEKPEADAEVSATEEKPEEESDDSEIKGGRIAPHNAKYRMPDGTLTTIEELANGYLRQSDYTRKRQADADKSRELDSEREKVSQAFQKTNQQLQLIETWVEQSKPRPPTDPNDYAGFIRYQQQSEQWKAWNDAVSAQRAEFDKAQEAQRTEDTRKYLNEENTRLVEKFPQMADKAKRDAFFGEAKKVLSTYGFSDQEISGISDHRLVLVVRDLMKARRDNTAQVKQKVESKPQLLRDSKRSGNAGAAQQRQVASERLAKSGSTADAVAVLKTLNL